MSDLHAEICEQPAVLARVFESRLNAIQPLVDAVKRSDIDFVYVAARGTSDHAGIYAKYLWGAYCGLTVALAAPSLFTLYGRRVNLKRALVLGISQSGESPDIIQVVEDAGKQGALTAVLTNAVTSPLAGAANVVLDLCAEKEQAVAATKSYTASLMTLALIMAALQDNPAPYFNVLGRLPETVSQVLLEDDRIAEEAVRYRDMDRCVVLSRGFNYATAFEWALKLKELTYLIAEPYSTADFLHGPIAMVEPGFPVLMVAPRGRTLDGAVSLAARLRRDYQAELVIVSDDERLLEHGHVALPLPVGLPEWVSPITGIVLAQLFSYHLTVAKGLDPEHPRGLSKVTRTT
jgi:glucosamine--fructose-6-phosphate aminotransferase (isomerizing)